MLLSATSLKKSFPGDDGLVAVLDGVSLEMAAGETLALTGESGSGKSTLLHVVAGLEDFDAGEVMLDGTALSTLDEAGRARMRRETVGVIFQQFNLIPSLNVGENIAFQARLAGRFDPAWVATLIARLSLADQATKFPEQLSGGQQQRVAIGRTLATRPKLVLADEPTGNLDEATSDAVMALMLELVAETGAGLLMVTHSELLAARLGRRLHLSHGKLGT